MTRNGKIARLPRNIREQINTRLQNGEEAKQIVQWLNALPEAKTVIEGEFDRQPFSETNLSRWKLGGYRDWEAHQDALEVASRIGEEGPQINGAAGGQLAENLALCLAARIALALRRLPSAGEDAAEQPADLRQLCADLSALRKGDHNAQWLKIERARLDLELKKYEEAAAARKRDYDQARLPPKKQGDGSVPKEVFDRFAEELRLL